MARNINLTKRNDSLTTVQNNIYKSASDTTPARHYYHTGFYVCVLVKQKKPETEFTRPTRKRKLGVSSLSDIIKFAISVRCMSEPRPWTKPIRLLFRETCNYGLVRVTCKLMLVNAASFRIRTYWHKCACYAKVTRLRYCMSIISFSRKFIH